MNITRVSYRRLISTGEYSNVSIGADADVEMGDTADSVLVDLTEWVNEQIQGYREDYAITEQVNDKRHELQRLERQITERREAWERLLSWFDKHGLEVPTRWREDADMPF